MTAKKKTTKRTSQSTAKNEANQASSKDAKDAKDEASVKGQPSSKSGASSKSQPSSKSEAVAKHRATAKGDTTSKSQASSKGEASSKPRSTAKNATSSKAKRGRSVGSASAASILGNTTTHRAQQKDYSQMEVKPEWVKYKKRLLDLRNQLANQMSGLTKQFNEELASHSMHIADSGTDNFDRDFALSLLSSDQDSIYEIDEALKRMEKNTYGVCELTGKPIPKARLDAIPWARYTVEAQGRLENEGISRQRRLGSLGSLEHSAGGGGEQESPAEEEESESNTNSSPSTE